MKRVYQTITDRDNGNCMQAVIASLFDKELPEVPNFIEHESWFPPLRTFIEERGYEYCGVKHNKTHSRLLAPTGGCFKGVKWHNPSIITKKCLYEHEGIGGYFDASVLSPHFFDWKDHKRHAVIIDKDFNIVHDPNPEYNDIKQYPLQNILGYNGVIDVTIINPKSH